MQSNSHDELKPSENGASKEEGRAARAQRFFFGDDIFVSYARHDSDYALALADGLTKKNLACFLDQWGTPAGEELPRELVDRLNKSTMLVIVGTERAAASDNVMKEVLEFKKTGRPIIPITFVGEEDFLRIRNNEIPENLTGTLERATWYREIAGIARTVESKARLKISESDEVIKPSPQVVTRIVNAEGFQSRSKRLRKAFWATFASLLVLLIAAGIIASLLINRAYQQVRNAQAVQAAAEAKAGQAERDRAAAEKARDDADRARVDAEGKTKQAQADLLTANQKTQEEQAKAAKARREAGKQQGVAQARQLANQSEFTLKQKADSLVESVSLAVKAANHSDVLGLHILEADTALRDSLGLLPRWVGGKELQGKINALSPDARYAATLIGDQKSGSPILEILQTADGKVIRHAPCADCENLNALSNDAGRVAMTIKNSDREMFRVKEVNGNLHWDIQPEEKSFIDLHVALSPDGKYLAIGYLDDNNFENVNGGQIYGTKLEIWEVESRRLIASPDTGFISLSSMAFSAQGKRLAIGGFGFGPRGNDAGKVLIWEIPETKDGLTADAIKEPEEFIQEETIYSDSGLAVSDDGRYIATGIAGPTTLVWKRMSHGDSQQVARLPVPVYSLAFGDDGQKLFTLSDAHASTPQSNFETWDITGRGEVSRTTDSGEIERSTFPSSGESIYHETPDKSANRRAALPAETEFEFNDGDTPYFSSDGMIAVRFGERNGKRSTSALIYRLKGNAYVRDPRVNPCPLKHDPNALSISPSQDYIVVSEGNPADENGYLQIINIKTGRDVTPKDIGRLDNVFSFNISPEGRYLAILLQTGEEDVSESDTHHLLIWDVLRARKIKLLNGKGWIKDATYKFSRNSAYLAVGDNSGFLQMWDFRKGELEQAQYYAPISAVAFSPNEKYLATGDINGLVIVSEAATHDEIAHLQHSGIVTQIIFSKNDRYVAVNTEANDSRFAEDENEKLVLHVWPLQLKDVLKEACQRLDKVLPGNSNSRCPNL